MTMRKMVSNASSLPCSQTLSNRHCRIAMDDIEKTVVRMSSRREVSSAIDAGRAHHPDVASQPAASSPRLPNDDGTESDPTLHIDDDLYGIEWKLQRSTWWLHSAGSSKCNPCVAALHLHISRALGNDL